MVEGILFSREDKRRLVRLTCQIRPPTLRSTTRRKKEYKQKQKGLKNDFLGNQFETSLSGIQASDAAAQAKIFWIVHKII